MVTICGENVESRSDPSKMPPEELQKGPCSSGCVLESLRFQVLSSVFEGFVIHGGAANSQMGGTGGVQE